MNGIWIATLLIVFLSSFASSAALALSDDPCEPAFTALSENTDLAPIDEAELAEYLQELSRFVLDEIQKRGQPMSVKVALEEVLEKKLQILARRSGKSIKEIRKRLLLAKSKTFFAARPSTSGGKGHTALAQELDQLPVKFSYLRTVGKGWVSKFAVHPDGRRVLSAEGDEARIWDLHSGEKLHELTDQTALVRAVSFSPDGTLAATASDDGTVRLWNTESGTPAGVLQIGKGIWSVGFSPNGEKLFINTLGVAGSPAEVLVSEVSSVASPPKALGYAVIVALSKQGGLAILQRGTVKIWEKTMDLGLKRLDQMAPSREVDVGLGITSVTYNPDGTKLALTTSYGCLGLIDLDGGEPMRLWNSYPGDRSLSSPRSNSVNFSSDGKWLVSAGNFGKTIWNTDTQLLLQDFPESTSAFNAIAFTPDGQRIIVGGASGLQVFEKNAAELK